MIGELIRRFRSEENLTQEDIAERLNITRQAISSWEAGKTEPDLEMIRKLAELFGISVEALLGAEDCVLPRILKITRECMPAVRLIGKRYTGSMDIRRLWQAWYREGRFDQLRADLPQNGDAHCLGAKRIVGGTLEYWIGFLCPTGTHVPEGYDSVEIEHVDYAVLKLYGKPLQLTSFETHQLCLDELRANGWERFEDHWCLERHGREDFGIAPLNTPINAEYCISVL